MRFVKMSVLWAGIAGLVSAGGCVQPGSLERGDVLRDRLNRYQKVMAEMGPQTRGSEGTAWLRPQPPAPGPGLEVENGKVHLTLSQAVMRALANNPGIRVVSYNPAISYQDMVRAAAAFDLVLFGTASYENQDLQGTPLGIGSGQAETRTFEAGVRQRLITGANWSTAWSLTRNWDEIGSSPLTDWEPMISLQVTQPLLRNAWPEFNLASLRIARLNRESSEHEFRQNVEELVFSVYQAYWTLLQARIDYEIQNRLLEVTIETRDRIVKRGAADATQVEIKQAEASVATRRAALVRAGKNIRDAQDALGRLLSDPNVNLLLDAEVLPTTPLFAEKLSVNESDQLLAALENSPLLQQLRTAISIAAINVRVAENQTLPRLDVTASTQIHGRDRSVHQSIENLGSLDYISYLIQLELEYPIGNRERLADLRKAQFEHLQAQASLQDTADAVAQQVRERIRQIETTWDEVIAQTQAVEAAQAQLDALEARENLLGRLTPEFLNVKLGAQQTLASASQGLLQARVAYNVATVELAQVTGTLLDWSRIQMPVGPMPLESLPAIVGDEPWPAEPETPGRAQTLSEVLGVKTRELKTGDDGNDGDGM